MNENDIILKAISLLEAIQEDNIEEAKSLVNYLNTNFEPTEEFYSLNVLIPLHSVIVHDNNGNDTFLYVLNNLKYIDDVNYEQLKWNIYAINLLKKGKYEEIENFLLNLIENNDIKDYQMPILIQMCVTIDNYNLLKEIRVIFNNKLNQEV